MKQIIICLLKRIKYIFNNTVNWGGDRQAGALIDTSQLKTEQKAHGSNLNREHAN